MLHISPAVEVNHKRNCGDDNEHHGTDRIQKETYVHDHAFCKRKPRHIKKLNLLADTIGYKFRISAEEIRERHSISHCKQRAVAADT